MKTFQYWYLFLTAIIPIPCQSGELVIISDLVSFVDSASKYDPRIFEKEITLQQALIKTESLRNKAVFPRLEATGVIGPAPAYTIITNSRGESIEKYDFENTGPFLGFEFKAYQPLSFYKLREGMNAAHSNEELAMHEICKQKTELNSYFQDIYFRYLFALQMSKLADEASKKLTKAINRLDTMLDSDSPGVSQSDLLELKTYVYDVDDGLYQARYGIEASRNAIAFSLGRDSFSLAESLLSVRNERLLPVDTLTKTLLLFHPDLQKLNDGIRIQTSKMVIARYDMLPEPFIAGSVTLKKSWAHQNHDHSENKLMDPFNDKEGTLGAGLRLNLNFWSAKDSYIKEKLELESLERKRSYAGSGLVLEMKNQHAKVLFNSERLASATVSFQSANQLLKSKLIQYDLEPSLVTEVFKAYEKYLRASKDYYQCILDYNISVAVLISKTGLTLKQYILLQNNHHESR